MRSEKKSTISAIKEREKFGIQNKEVQFNCNVHNHNSRSHMLKPRNNLIEIEKDKFKKSCKWNSFRNLRPQPRPILASYLKKIKDKDSQSY